jgi:hypothetical protein
MQCPFDGAGVDNKFRLFREQWEPKVIAEMNDYQFKLVVWIGQGSRYFPYPAS